MRGRQSWQGQAQSAAGLSRLCGSITSSSTKTREGEQSKGETKGAALPHKALVLPAPEHKSYNHGTAEWVGLEGSSKPNSFQPGKRSKRAEHEPEPGQPGSIQAGFSQLLQGSTCLQGASFHVTSLLLPIGAPRPFGSLELQGFAWIQHCHDPKGAERGTGHKNGIPKGSKEDHCLAQPSQLPFRFWHPNQAALKS